MKSSALLLLASKSLGVAAPSNFKPDCLIYWGVANDFKTCEFDLLLFFINELTRSTVARKSEGQAACSYMLLTSEEYSNASVQKDLASHGIMKHPSHPLLNRYDEGSLLSELRQKTVNVLRTPGSTNIVQLLYYVRMQPPLLTCFAIAN